MSKKGDVKRENRPDGKVEVWQLIDVEDDENAKQVHKNRVKMMERELETVEDFDEEMVAQSAINEERKMRRQMKDDIEAQIKQVKEIIGDE